MDAQWLIDTAGKIGPATVALAVLAATVAQNRWNNTVARRSAAIEDQKVRLALLERRLQVLTKFERFRDEWDLLETIDSSTLRQFGEAMYEAELVFPSAAKDIRACHHRIFAYTRTQHDLYRVNRNGNENERHQAQQDAAERGRDLDLALGRTREVLLATARVDDVEPLPPPLASRIARTVLRRL